jgi:hypothetical protein
MPVIKRFSHCLVRMNLKDHAPPHFHVLMRDGREAWIAIPIWKSLMASFSRKLIEVLQWATDNGKCCWHIRGVAEMNKTFFALPLSKSCRPMPCVDFCRR